MLIAMVTVMVKICIMYLWIVGEDDCYGGRMMLIIKMVMKLFCDEGSEWSDEFRTD